MDVDYVVKKDANNNNTNILVITSIWRPLGNITFSGKSITQLSDASLVRILYKLVTKIELGKDSIC